MNRLDSNKADATRVIVDLILKSNQTVEKVHILSSAMSKEIDQCVLASTSIHITTACLLNGTSPYVKQKS